MKSENQERPDGGRGVSARTYALLRERIASLQLLPGQALFEKEVAEEMGISRTPVREATLRLADEGLVDIYPRKGTFVAPIRISAMLQAAFVRDSLECSIIRVLALTRRSHFLDQLHASITRQWSAVRAGDAEVFYYEDELMHQSFAEESGHEPVRRVIEAAKIHVDRVRRLQLPEDLRVRSLVEEHERIVEALVAQDADAAVHAMHDHLDGIVRDVRRIAQRYPDYFDNISRKPGKLAAPTTAPTVPRGKR